MDKEKLMAKFTGEKKDFMTSLDEKVGAVKLQIGQLKECRERLAAEKHLETAFIWAGKAVRSPSQNAASPSPAPVKKKKK